MTISEVIADIRSRNKEKKLYGTGKGEMKQPQFSRTLTLIEAGMCKPNTIQTFFNRFGYTGSFNEWRKAGDK